MTTARLHTPALGLALGVVGSLALAASAVQAAGPVELYYERVLMGVAGARCNLFSGEVSSGLAAAASQARGAALRAGQTDRALDEVRRRAELKAYGADCKGRDLATAAERVRSAFAGYGRIWKMNFPSAHGGWSADRATPGKTGEPRWRLVQSKDGVGFGILAEGPGERLAAVFPEARASGAMAARLVLRDPAKAPRPYLDPRKPGLAGATAPRDVSRAILASDRGPAPASVGGGVAFSFPASAQAALARLDPREAATIELVFPTRQGERTSAILMEVGDFAAGQAFLAAR